MRRQGELEEENKDERGRQARRRSLNFLGRKGSESRDADDQAGNGSGRCSAAALGRASEDTRPWQADGACRVRAGRGAKGRDEVVGRVGWLKEHKIRDRSGFWDGDGQRWRETKEKSRPGAIVDWPRGFVQRAVCYVRASNLPKLLHQFSPDGRR